MCVFGCLFVCCASPLLVLFFSNVIRTGSLLPTPIQNPKGKKTTHIHIPPARHTFYPLAPPFLSFPSDRASFFFFFSLLLAINCLYSTHEAAGEKGKEKIHRKIAPQGKGILCWKNKGRAPYFPALTPVCFHTQTQNILSLKSPFPSIFSLPHFWRPSPSSPPLKQHTEKHIHTHKNTFPKSRGFQISCPHYVKRNKRTHLCDRAPPSFSISLFPSTSKYAFLT